MNPTDGKDDPTQTSDAYINDPSMPAKTLQFAIDWMSTYLRKSCPTPPTKTEGIVYAMPGLYGSHGTYSSGDIFPIWMQDRVHLQGTGARECVIRGGSAGSNLFPTFWPTPTSPMPQAKEVLIAFRDSSRFSRTTRGLPGNPTQFVPPNGPGDLTPWVGLDETAEMIDGFTFQGGDVQILIQPPYPNGSYFFDFPLNARITNCVFDMRYNWTASEQTDGAPPTMTYTVAGPTFAVLMVKLWHSSNGFSGYFDQEVLVASNTFVMAEWQLGASNGGWLNIARSDAVAVMDVTDPNPGLVLPGGVRDLNQQLRGVGRPNVINNLFRTWPGQQAANTGHMAMLGIDLPDTRASDNIAVPRDTNAFTPSRVGGQNQTFSATPVQPVVVGPITVSIFQTTYTMGSLYDCTSTPTGSPCAATSVPVPKVILWDGSSSTTPQAYDPAFVGEYLTSVSGVASDYRDWRLLPDSPLVNQGWYTHEMVFDNGVTRFLPGTLCSEIESFDFDGEEYGNPRIIGDQIDIGFDEVHMLVMAGSHANDSNAHNINVFPNGVLHPSAPAGSVTRQMILPSLFANQTIKINGTMSIVNPGGTVISAWIQPPVTLTPPTVDAAAVRDYHLRYISQNNPAPTPTQWLFSFPPPANWTLGTHLGIPGSPQLHAFVHVTQIDNECTTGCTQSYFNTQAFVDFGASGKYRSNLQAEFR